MPFKPKIEEEEIEEIEEIEEEVEPAPKQKPIRREMQEIKKAVTEKPKDRYEPVEVAIQKAQMIYDTKSETVLDDKAVINEILNKLDRIEKSIG